MRPLTSMGQSDDERPLELRPLFDQRLSTVHRCLPPLPLRCSDVARSFFFAWIFIRSMHPGSNAKRVSSAGCSTAPTSEPPGVTTSCVAPEMPGLSRSTNLPWMVMLPGAADLAARQDARLADDELGALAQRDGALLEQALDLHRGARVELQVRVAQHVALAEVALEPPTASRPAEPPARRRRSRLAFLRLAPCDARVAHLGADQARLLEVRAGEVGAREVGLVELGRRQVGVAQVGVRELRADEVRPAELRRLELRVREARARRGRPPAGSPPRGWRGSGSRPRGSRPGGSPPRGPRSPGWPRAGRRRRGRPRAGSRC